MKKYALAIIALLIIFRCNSQTMHAIIFAKTNDKTIGLSAKKNSQIMVALAGLISQQLNYTLNQYVFEGNEFTHKNLDSILRHLQVKNGDIVLFYISTHGYKSSNPSKFPRLVFKDPGPERRLVSADTINKYLVQISAAAKSVITITQACNKTTNASKDLPIPILEDKSIALYKLLKPENIKLLFLSGNNIQITSSMRGKTSIANSSKGSNFTRSLARALIEATVDSTRPSWNDVLTKARSYSNKLDGKKPRHPQWEIRKL